MTIGRVVSYTGGCIGIDRRVIGSKKPDILNYSLLLFCGKKIKYSSKPCKKYLLKVWRSL
jgi:hypothetical protein